MLGLLFERFVEKSPVSVMMRGLMERVFAPEAMNKLFETTARVQYTKELLSSDLIELMVGLSRDTCECDSFWRNPVFWGDSRL